VSGSLEKLPACVLLKSPVQKQQSDRTSHSSRMRGLVFLNRRREMRYPGNVEPMDPHSIIIVSLHTPKEKLWGELLSINPAGITIRGIDLNSFDHFVNQINGPDQERTGLPTLFFPMNRVERIALDESSGSIPSLSEVFARKVGRPIAEYLAQFA
jgi:hypothetical protein